jgi:hypothetical protein
MQARRRVLLVFSSLTGAGILLQWILVWVGAFPVEETIPGYRDYFLSFVVADTWLILAAFLTTVFLLRGDPRAAASGVALGSAMLFFGLYAITYDLRTGLLWQITMEEVFGKAVTLYNVLGGVFLMLLSWRIGRVPGSDGSLSL